MTAPLPALTVVLCAAGNGTHLPSQLAALVQQGSRVPWEFVFVDNGCTTACLAEVSTWLPRLPGGRVVDAREVAGPSYGRNKGAAAARAPAIAFCDDDDIVAPGWVDAMAAALQSSDLVGGLVRVNRLNSPEVLSWRLDLQSTGLPSMLGHLPYAMSCNMGVRRDRFLSLDGFDLSLYPGEDVDLSWRLLYDGGTIGFAPEAVIDYRYRTDLRSYLKQQRAYGRVSALLLLKHRRHGATAGPLGPRLLQVVRIAAGARNLLRPGPRLNRWLGIVSYWWTENITLLRARVGRTR